MKNNEMVWVEYWKRIWDIVCSYGMGPRLRNRKAGVYSVVVNEFTKHLVQLAKQINVTDNNFIPAFSPKFPFKSFEYAPKGYFRPYPF
tara:strand:- start:1394 stop:1657 length:264 start_codon:yes stop_codon:yes gene_type:complete